VMEVTAKRGTEDEMRAGTIVEPMVDRVDMAEVRTTFFEEFVHEKYVS
jgi:hypothetical protein